jgi:optic atrophy 3 protein
LFSVAAALIIGETWRSSRSQTKQRSNVNDSIEELQTRMRELNERLQTWEEAASEERQRCVISRTCLPMLTPSRHQELAHIIDRVIDIGLRGGAWAELQDDTPLQSPRIQSNLPIPMSPSAPDAAERTRTERLPSSYPANTVQSNDA